MFQKGLGSRSFGSAGWFFISAERVVTVLHFSRIIIGAEQAGILDWAILGSGGEYIAWKFEGG